LALLCFLAETVIATQVLKFRRASHPLGTQQTLKEN
jgi:hypothetical protein